MGFIRVRVMLASSLLAVAAGASGVVLSGPASAGTSQVVLVGCHGAGQVRPAGYDIGCMPSQELVTGLAWTSWRSAAFGSGILKVSDCTPTCAQGRYVTYPILVVTAYDARAWGAWALSPNLRG